MPLCYTDLFRQFQIEQLVDVFFQPLQNVVLYLLKTVKIQQYFTITYHLFCNRLLQTYLQCACISKLNIWITFVAILFFLTVFVPIPLISCSMILGFYLSKLLFSLKSTVNERKLVLNCPELQFFGGESLKPKVL